MQIRRVVVRLFPIFLAFGIIASVHAQAVNVLSGSWYIASGRAAPWVATPEPLSGTDRRFLGQTVVFSKARILAPTVLGCKGVTYAALSLLPEALFQGGLPAPVEDAARALGLQSFPAPSIRVTCDTGVFDYHMVDDATALVALDNVIWTLSANPRTPRALVSAVLKDHFSHDMAFTAKNANRKLRYFSVELARDLQSYFEASRPVDEAPPINGDPFTNTQEHPKSYVVERAKVDGNVAVVGVRHPMKPNSRTLKWILLKGPQGWRVDDIHYVEGATLRSLLKVTQ
jgi:hypothetical protein